MKTNRMKYFFIVIISLIVYTNLFSQFDLKSGGGYIVKSGENSLLYENIGFESDYLGFDRTELKVNTEKNKIGLFLDKYELKNRDISFGYIEGRIGRERLNINDTYLDITDNKIKMLDINFKTDNIGFGYKLTNGELSFTNNFADYYMKNINLNIFQMQIGDEEKNLKIYHAEGKFDTFVNIGNIGEVKGNLDGIELKYKKIGFSLFRTKLSGGYIFNGDTVSIMSMTNESYGAVNADIYFISLKGESELLKYSNSCLSIKAILGTINSREFEIDAKNISKETKIVWFFPLKTEETQTETNDKYILKTEIPLYGIINAEYEQTIVNDRFYIKVAKMIPFISGIKIEKTGQLEGENKGGGEVKGKIEEINYKDLLLTGLTVEMKIRF